MLILHRAELDACLLAAVPPDVVRTEATIVDVEQTTPSATVSYRTADGARERVTAVVVVGAGGVRSGVRQAVLPDSVEPAYAGFTAWPA